jgi:hypothetical protein
MRIHSVAFQLILSGWAVGQLEAVRLNAIVTVVCAATRLYAYTICP